MVTPRLWWLWVVAELGREGIWCLDAAAAADGALLAAYDELTGWTR